MRGWTGPRTGWEGANSMQIVPLIQYPNQELMCILDNQNCTIRVTVRSGYTFLDLRVDDTVIREGQLCDPWSWVLATPNDFKGNFMLVDTARTIATQERAQYDGLGDRWILYYFTEAEAAEVDRLWRLSAEEYTEEEIIKLGYGLGAYGIMRYGLY